MSKINNSMKKIWFFGDSWCNNGDPGTWPFLLAEQNNCQIAHLGTAGMSLQGTLQEFLDNVDYIQKEDIVVFVYTSVNRWRFKNSCYRLGVATREDIAQSHQNITEEQYQTFCKYLIHLSDNEEEVLRSACIINFMLNYNLPCKSIHIPAFADFPIKYLPNFKEIGINIKSDNTYNLTRMIWDIESKLGLENNFIQTTSYEWNHCGAPGSEYDSNQIICDLAQELIDNDT